jgi:hypothetical protein
MAALVGGEYDPQIVTSLRQRIEQAIDAQSDKAEQRARAWQQFIGAPDGNELEGRSQVQASDVNSTITAVLANMVISFATDTVVSFAANNAEDEAGAKAEARAVNKVLMEDNPGFRRILEAIQNALMYRTGYIKVWWAVDKQTYTVSFDQVEAVDLPVLAESEPGKERRLISYDPKKQKARLEITESSNRLTVRTVMNERFFIDPDHEDQELDGCLLCGEVHYKTRDELARMGVDRKIVEALPSTVKNSGSEQSRHRAMSGAVEPIVKQAELCRVYEAYARLTFDEDDDRTYLYKCWIGDRTQASSGWLLDPEPVSRIPYASGTAFPIANQHDGEALSEKLYQVQAGKTALLRQWQDNIQNCSFGRYAVVVGQGVHEDIMTPKAGGPVRVKSMNAVTPLQVIDVGPSIKMGMDEYDKLRSEKAGAALDMVSAPMQIAGDAAATAHGTERVLAAAETISSYQTRNLAETMFRRLFLLAHAELRDGDGGPIQMKVGEQWITADPRQWPARTHCNVNVAPSFGERMLQASALMQTIGLYQAAMQAGLEGELVSKPGLYKLCNDWLRLNLVDDPESYFVDPTSQGAQQAAQMKQQGAQQSAEAQKELLAIPEQIKAMSDKYKSDQETQFDYFKTIIEAMLENAKTETEGMINVIDARTKAQAVQGTTNGANGGAGGRTNGNGSKGNGSGAGKPGRKDARNSRAA